jgi:prepilin-type N-terminal cleavage/methylation domain-containing protein
MNRTDNGFTLIELLVASSFLAVIVLIGSTLLTTGFRAQSQVDAMTGASSRGEIVARSVESGVRNSSDYSVGIPDSVGNQLLRARVAIGVSAEEVSWQCQGWYYDAAAARVWTITSEQAIPEIASAGDVSEWTLLASGIEVDQNMDADGDGLPDGNAQIFSGSVNELRLQYIVTDGDVALVLVPSTIVKQLEVTGGTGPATCY